MMRGELLVSLVVAVIVLGFGLWVGLSFLSPQARRERRRRKSHGRVIPKTKRPMVRFSVRTPRK